MKEHNIKMQNVAIITLDLEDILYSLGFPKEMRVRSFWHNRDNPFLVDISIIHDDLPQVQAGSAIPRIMPQINKERGQKPKLVDWGIDD